MPIRNDFQPGEFCWIDLNAHDKAAAAEWYGNLFGWTPVDQPTPPGAPTYAFFMKGDVPAAAVGQMTDEMKAQGVPPCWNSYVAVADCEATEKKAAELGANVLCPTTEIPGHGKLCFIMDPDNTPIAMWQQTGPGDGVYVAEPGGLSWNELLCRDVAKAREFYGQLFGWTYYDMPMGDITYTMIKVGDKDAGGMMAMEGPQFEGVPNHWAVYFDVADCESTATKVVESGGQVRVPPTAIQVGRFAVCGDPQGGTFSIIEKTATC